MLVMRVVWLHIGAAVALAMQVVSASSAGTTVSDDNAIATTGDLGFSAISAASGSYKSVARSGTDDGGSSSTMHILPGHYEFDHRRWRLKPYVGADFNMAGRNEKR